ncbi:MAG: OmpA family protein [Flavobacteriaceae bacterium]
MLKALYIFVFFYITSSTAQNDTIAVYYDIGKYKLTKQNKTIIQNQLEKLTDSIKYNVQIISSCDFLGSNTQNLELSSKRASIVKDLLFEKNNIIISSITQRGVGELDAGTIKKKSSGIINHRRTMLIFKKQSNYVFDAIASSKPGETFVIKNIVFDPGRHFFKKRSIKVVKKLLNVLKKNPNLKIEISGHVCCGKDPNDTIDAYDKDSETYNLSHNRAKHIYKYLVLKKIDSTRLKYKGYGFRKPLKFPELTAKDKLNNRRVEIKVLSN